MQEKTRTQIRAIVAEKRMRYLGDVNYLKNSVM